MQNKTAPPQIERAIKSVSNPKADDYNVLTDSQGGDPNHVVVIDARLDAIYGAGMLDNASGSATILDIAHMMRKVQPRNKTRFCCDNLGNDNPAIMTFMSRAFARMVIHMAFANIATNTAHKADSSHVKRTGSRGGTNAVCG